MAKSHHILSFVLVTLLAACQIGPRALHSSHSQYSQAVREIADEEMLLNLVRIRYYDMPVFLQVSSISTQFAIRSDASMSGTINENVGPTNVPNVLGLNGSLGYEERPTITFDFPESREFMGRMLAPLGADQLTVLAHTGAGRAN